MICRAVDYVKLAYEYAGEDVPVKVTNLIASDAYKAISDAEHVSVIPKSETSVGNINSIIASAQLDIGSELRFRFNIKSGANATLTVKTVTVNETYEIVDGECDGEGFIVVKMRAFDMYDGVITLISGENVGTYDLKAYANSGALELDDTGMLNELLIALYNYCREANEYSKVQNKDFRSTASVVVKDGMEGTVSFVLDDGKTDAAALVTDMLKNYTKLKLTFALIPNSLATLNTVYNEETGKYVYVLDDNGDYTYTLNQTSVDFWQGLLEAADGRYEYVSHSLTHAFWGIDNNGGVFTYVDSEGNLRDSKNLPEGSVTAEVYASTQLIADIFGMGSETIVLPGISAPSTDVVKDGETYVSCYHCFYEVIRQAYLDGTIIGMRGNGFGAANVTPDKVVLPEYLLSIDNRLDVNALTAKNYNDVNDWFKFIDYAMELGGWAPFCLHKVVPDGEETSELNIYESQAKALFDYAESKNIWIANYTEATKYYTEWSTAVVNAVYNNGSIKVTLTDSENDELFDEALTVRVTVPGDWQRCLVNGVDSIPVKVAESGERYVLVNIVPDSGVVTLTAKSIEKVSVVFNDGDGATIQTVTVDEGELIPSVFAPAKDNYRFDGWYYGETLWNFETMTVSENITLTARWVRQYAVVFDTDCDDVEVPTQYVDEGGYVSRPATPDRGPLYSFDGWYLKDTDTEWKFIAEEKYAIHGDIVLVAGWSIMTPSDSFN